MFGCASIVSADICHAINEAQPRGKNIMNQAILLTFLWIADRPTCSRLDN